MGDDNLSRVERQRIFYEELEVLKNKQYININVYRAVSDAYKKHVYYEWQQETNLSSQQNNTSQQVQTQNNENIKKEQPPLHTKELTNSVTNVNINKIQHNLPPKQLTAEEIREKNLNIMLVLGTTFILLAGLIFGTTAWFIAGNGFRTFLLILLGTIFFGISVLCEKVLKVKKSSFTFWVLGTMFLPLSLLSIGFFGLLGSFLSLRGEGQYLFKTVSSLICMPVFYYSFKKYAKEFYLYVLFLNIDFLIVNLISSIGLSPYVHVILITMFNAFIVFLFTSKDKFKDIKILNLVRFNIIASAVILGFNFGNVYGFYINLIAFSIMLMYINVASNCVTPLRTILSLLSFGSGFCGVIYKLVANYLIKDYCLVIPLLLFLSYITIYKYLKDRFQIEDKTYYHISMLEGIISFLILSSVTPFYMQYRIISIVGFIINGAALISYCKLYTLKPYRIVTKLLTLPFVYTITLLLCFNMHSHYRTIYLSATAFALFLLWPFVKKVNFLKEVYVPMLISIQFYSLFTISIIMVKCHEYVFIALGCICLMSLYCYYKSIYESVHKYVSAISYYVTLVSSYWFIHDIQNQYNFSMHIATVFLVLFITECIIKIKVKNFINFIKHVMYANGLLALVYILVVSTLSPIHYNQHKPYLIAFCILNLCYYGYNYFKYKFIAYPTLIGLFSGTLIYTIFNTYSNIFNISLIVSLSVLYLSYVYYKEDIYLYNIYGFTFLYYALTLDSKFVFQAVSTALMIALFTITYIKKLHSENIIISLTLGILALVIPQSHFSNNHLLAGAYISIAVIARAAGLKLYAKILEKTKIDMLSVISTFLFLISLYFCEYEKYGAYIRFGICFILSLSILMELLRDAKYSKGIKLASQIIISQGYYILMSSLHLKNILLFKVYLIPVLALYLSIKVLFRNKIHKEADYLFAGVICIWLLADAYTVDTVLNNIVIGAFALLAMLLAMNKNNKIVTSASITVIAGVLLIGSRYFLLSLPWWVYLLATGSALIGIAVYLENKKNKKS